MKAQGIVFDIQRFSLHDGPGIRTTVFLKGCPLRCIWCHNPESWDLWPQLLYKASHCANCGKCASVCKACAHTLENGSHSFDRSLCSKNFACVEQCYYQALKISGDKTDVTVVMREVEADEGYYRNSGGGLTLSGGEPMLQFQFSMELLKAARAKNIHTCIETCGFAPTENFREMLGVTDLFLYDIKAVDPEKHMQLTGVNNRLILENLEFLYKNGAAIILRCPIVSGVNDSQQHFEDIAALARRYPELKGIEIMPYHDMGKEKWQEAGYQYLLCDVESVERAMEEKWRKDLEDKIMFGMEIQ